MKIIIYSLISILIFFVSCKSYDNSYSFKGEGLKNTYSSNIYNYSNQDTVFDIKFPDWKNKKTNPKFLNQSKTISIQNNSENISNIIRLDYNGNIKDTLFVSHENEIISTYCINLTDSLIILRTLDYSDFLNDSSIYRKYNTYPVNYKLINLITKEKSNILQISSTHWTYGFEKNIWLNNSKEVVINEYKRDELNKRIDYIFKLNIHTNDTSFIDFGYYPSVSNNDLLYVYQDNIYLYDLNTNTKQSIYKIPKNKKLTNLEWIPNSTDIHIRLYSNKLFDKFTGGKRPFNTKWTGIIINKKGNVLTRKYKDFYDDWK